MLPISSRITLIAPGCFSVLAPTEPIEELSQQADSTPELNESTVMATSTRAYEQVLAAALKQTVPELGALPIAQHRFFFDTDKKAPPHCVCAELIHLQADKDNARLLPMRALDVTPDESEQLVGSLNDLIRADGLEIVRTSQYRYYLTGMPASELDTWPAHAVANGKIADYLPRKTDAGDWRRLMTEVQMLFHTHPINAARAKLQQLPINGMWFWGGVQATTRTPIEPIAVISADAYACGLAGAIDINPVHPNNFDWAAFDGKGEVVIVELGVYEAWLQGDQNGLQNAKQALQDQWITPAQEAVANGLCSEFVLDGCEGQAIVEKPKQALERFSLKRFSPRQWFSRIAGAAPKAGDRINKSDSNT